MQRRMNVMQRRSRSISPEAIVIPNAVRNLAYLVLK